MSSSLQLQAFDEIKAIITKLTNEVADLKKSNDELKEEISTVKDELKELKSNNSSDTNPEQTLFQNPTEPIN